MDRLDIINFFVEKYGYEDYCEIGVFTGYTLDGCRAKNKIGIDPDCKHYKGPNRIICKTSDEFFAELPEDKKFGLFFIDGLHEAAQVEKDIHNALDHLSPGGTIVLHDCNPPKFEHTTTGIDGCWTGDTYKAFVKFALQYPEYETYTIDTDWGCGVIHTPPRDGGNIGWIDMPTKDIQVMLEWDYFDRNRKDLLNLISVEEFKTKESERTTDNNSTTK